MNINIHCKHALIFSLLLAYNSVKSQNFISFADTRATSTTPSTYNLRLEPHFKVNSVLGLPYGSNPYYSLLGFRGWLDDSGGKGHELAFSNHGKIYWRSGYNDSGWENWREVMVTDDTGQLAVNGNLYSTVSTNEGGALSLVNPVKMEQSQAYRWTIFNMTGSYGNSLQFWSYNHDTSVMGARMVLTDNGNLGIGIVTPSEKLAVNGNIRAKEVKVEAANWPDYVFDQDYNLLGLTELEDYIKKNKHLPEIPSAKEIEQKGAELGDILKRLMKSHEELTLHVILQYKEIQALKSKLKGTSSTNGTK